MVTISKLANLLTRRADGITTNRIELSDDVES